MRFSFKTIVLLLLIASVIAAVASCTRKTQQAVRNSYAVWWVADMVVEHLDANAGEWPKGWGDLKDDYQLLVGTSEPAWSFEELQSRVEVKWDARPDELVQQAGDGIPAFRVIWLSDGTDSHWSGREPNQIVLDYLIDNQN